MCNNDAKLLQCVKNTQHRAFVYNYDDDVDSFEQHDVQVTAHLTINTFVHCCCLDIISSKLNLDYVEGYNNTKRHCNLLSRVA
eukprot:6200377-Pleurochrysis_carterae.AAC.1